jgi:transposase
MMQTMKPYSEDLRRRIVRAVQDGMSKSSAACLFGVSLSSVKRYLRVAKRRASLAPRKGGGRPPKTNETVEKLFEEDVEKFPAATVSERRRFLVCTTGTALSDSTVKRLLKRLAFSRKNELWERVFLFELSHRVSLTRRCLTKNASSERTITPMMALYNRYSPPHLLPLGAT